MNRLGVITSNPLKVSKQSPVPSKKGVLIDVEEKSDGSLYDLLITDENGLTTKYTIKVKQ
jgi:hypothetical protein